MTSYLLSTLEPGLRMTAMALPLKLLIESYCFGIWSGPGNLVGTGTYRLLARRGSRSEQQSPGPLGWHHNDIGIVHGADSANQPSHLLRVGVIENLPLSDLPDVCRDHHVEPQQPMLP